ncbi:TPA: hypothetical protein O7142_002090 [Salmonella enterica]|nr:hypothetical protein [Salmonella enterica]
MVAIASMKVLAFLYLYTRHTSSGMCVGFPRFPSHLIMSPPGIRRAACLQPELFRVHNGANAFYSHSYF